MNKNNNKVYLNKKKYGSAEYLAIILCSVIGLMMIVLLCMKGKNDNGQLTYEASDYDLIDLYQSETESIISNGEESELSEENNLYDVVEIPSENVYKGDLILVNKENPYAFKEELEILDVYDYKNEKYKLGAGTEKLFEKTIVAANEFLGDFYDISSLTNVTMVNGYFSYDEQQKRYEKYIKEASEEDAQKWGVKAGVSDHHTALSFNLMLYPSNGKIGEGEYAWLVENAFRYGFIVRYPSDKTEITSVKDENHFRYVGIPHAEYIYQNKLTLEEYISILSETSYGSPLKITSGNKEYIVYYSPADSSSSVTEVKIPKGYSYSCSGDNISGLIITAYLP